MLLLTTPQGLRPPRFPGHTGQSAWLCPPQSSDTRQGRRAASLHRAASARLQLLPTPALPAPSPAWASLPPATASAPTAFPGFLKECVYGHLNQAPGRDPGQRPGQRSACPESCLLARQTDFSGRMLGLREGGLATRGSVRGPEGCGLLTQLARDNQESPAAGLMRGRDPASPCTAPRGVSTAGVTARTPVKHHHTRQTLGTRWNSDSHAFSYPGL